MSKDDVHEIAQGRIWTGRQAMKRGLVDTLGDYDDAIKLAAELASIEKYDVNVVQQKLSPQEQFFAELFNNSAASNLLPKVSRDNSSDWLLKLFSDVQSATALE